MEEWSEGLGDESRCEGQGGVKRVESSVSSNVTKSSSNRGLKNGLGHLG